MMYKKVYQEIIMNEEKLIEAAKMMLEADKKIKTMDNERNSKNYTPEQREKLDYLWRKMA